MAKSIHPNITAVTSIMTREKYDLCFNWLKSAGVRFTTLGPYLYNGQVLASFNLYHEDATAFKLKFDIRE